MDHKNMFLLLLRVPVIMCIQLGLRGTCDSSWAEGVGSTRLKLTIDKLVFMT